MMMLLGLAAAACAVPGDEVTYGETSSAISVGTAVSSTCTTSSVRGLAIQIAREVDCTWPTSLAKFTATSRITFTSSAVLPFLHGGAKTDLTRVANNHALRVNSGYRTVVQQYLLYRWSQIGRCGIGIAALPGRSNHEGGRAVDLANWSTRVSAMRNHHWSHSVPGDPVHFDHFGSPDNRGKDVRAFQRLWNRNHPNDKIAVDGSYGPATAARLRRAPAKGFAKGALCTASLVAPEDTITPELDVLAIEGPELVAPAERMHYVMAIANPSDVEWPATARLVIADGTASPLYDDATWTSPTEVGELGVAVPARGDAEIDLDVLAPMVVEETPVALDLAVVDGANRLGTFQLAFTVTPNGDAGTSSEAGHGDEDDEGLVADEDGVVLDEGGCNTSGAASGWLALLLLGLVRRRRG
ncbi:MAG TPA: M15 family metallopeptidase [Kofleriaceae bacterium]